MKKLLSRLLCTAFIFCSTVLPAFAAGDTHVTVDGEPVTFTDAAPFVSADNRTMVPLRAVGTALGCAVSWNSEAQIAKTSYHVTVPGHLEDEDGSIFGKAGAYDFNDDFTLDLYFKEGQNLIAYTHQETWSGGDLTDSMDVSMKPGAFTIDVAPVIVEGRTYLPIRAVAEMYKCTVGWDNSTQTVSIKRDGEWFGALNDDNGCATPDWVVTEGFA